MVRQRTMREFLSVAISCSSNGSKLSSQLIEGRDSGLSAAITGTEGRRGGWAIRPLSFVCMRIGWPTGGSQSMQVSHEVRQPRIGSNGSVSWPLVPADGAGAARRRRHGSRRDRSRECERFIKRTIHVTVCRAGPRDPRRAPESARQPCDELLRDRAADARVPVQVPIRLQTNSATDGGQIATLLFGDGEISALSP